MFKRSLLLLHASLFGVLITAAATFSQTINLLKNPGFENESLEGWSAADSCGLELFRAASREGKQSLVFRPLREGGGVRLDASGLTRPGHTYLFDAWFRNAELGWGQADVLFRCVQTGKTQNSFIGRVDCDKSDWKELSGFFSIPADADPNSLVLVLKTAWGLNAFLVDDCVLRPALQVNAARVPGRDAPDLLLDLGPEDALRKNLRTRLNVTDSRGRRVESSDRMLDAPVSLNLAPGFYKAAATLTDLDGRKFNAEKTFFSGTLAALDRSLFENADALISDRSFQDYRGWIQYLRFLASYYGEREGRDSDRFLQAALRLDRWTRTVRENPKALDSLSGVYEWAYSSRADDTGQPFKLAIPTRYDRRKSYPLAVVMHGYGGNHMEYSGGAISNPDYFEMHVLGRARGGRYISLSEADVLDAVDYICAHWSIDTRRIHLTGASMGGGGTFKLSSRYPDRWASGRPVCGYGSDQPFLNAQHVPIYSTHSQDDPTVPVLASRAPLRKLLEAGGRVVLDETNGLQHAAWNYADGNRRGQEWFIGQLRPDFRDVHSIDYTAVDRKACRAYWLEIAEWGPGPGPAHFRASLGDQNELHLVLDNVQTLKIDRSASPIDAGKKLRVSVNGGLLIDFPAPLPENLFVNREKGVWSVLPEQPHPPEFCLRSPGGVFNLYAGDPLLIVYGTSGSDSSNRAMARAAQAASKSMNPMWVDDQGDIKDGVPSHHILYGRLRTKPDTSVTDVDLAGCNLVLIGRASENRLVEKMSDRLPVRFAEEIICSDGARVPRTNAIAGLCHYNPLSPGRLIYWVAADQPAFYKPYPFLLQLQGDQTSGPDLLVVQENPPKIIRIRSFDSRWKWNVSAEQSAVIESRDAVYGSLMTRIAESMCRALGADYAMMLPSAPPQLEMAAAGVTRWSDIASLDMNTKLAVLELKGTDLDVLRKETLKEGSPVQLMPAAKDAAFVAEENYRIVMNASFSEMQQIIRILNRAPEEFEMTDITVYEAMKRYLF
jgi:dienelactone hydrolase